MKENSDDDFATLSAIKVCPRCGQDLEQGYIVMKASWWNENKPEPWWKFGTRNRTLTQIGYRRHPSFAALRCEQCHFVTFDYTFHISHLKCGLSLTHVHRDFNFLNMN